MTQLEARARRLAARKMGLHNDLEGKSVPHDLWRQCLDDAYREIKREGTYLPPDFCRDQVKVRVGYEDGHHWLEEYTDEMARLNMPFVTVEQHVWAQWQAHCASARAWNSYCQLLGNELYEKDQALYRKENPDAA